MSNRTFRKTGKPVQGAEKRSGEEGKCDIASLLFSKDRPSDIVFQCVGDGEQKWQGDQKGGHCSNQDGTGLEMSRV